MSAGYVVLRENPKQFFVEVSLRVQAVLVDADHAELVVSGDTCGYVARNVLGELWGNVHSDFVRIVDCADGHCDSRLVQHEYIFVLDYGNAYIVQLDGFVVGDVSYDFGMRYDVRVSTVNFVVLAPFLEHVSFDRTGNHCSCGIAVSARKSFDVAVLFCSVEAGDDCVLILAEGVSCGYERALFVQVSVLLEAYQA